MKAANLVMSLTAFAARAALMAGADAPAASHPAPVKKKSDADGNNDMPDRARWEWKLLDGKGETARVGTFMGYRTGEIKLGKEKTIGSFRTEKAKVIATFTAGPLKGVATMVLVERKPIKYKGDLVRGDGSRQKLTVEIVND